MKTHNSIKTKISQLKNMKLHFYFFW